MGGNWEFAGQVPHPLLWVGKLDWEFGSSPHLIREHCSEVVKTNSPPPSFPKPERVKFHICGHVKREEQLPRQEGEYRGQDQQLQPRLTLDHFSDYRQKCTSKNKSCSSGCFFWWIEKCKMNKLRYQLVVGHMGGHSKLPRKRGGNLREKTSEKT